jgi:hypothetical protein
MKGWVKLNPTVSLVKYETPVIAVTRPLFNGNGQPVRKNQNRWFYDDPINYFLHIPGW